MDHNSEIIKLLVSLLAGGILGFEREYKNKNAGFRTIILITVGSTLFTIFSSKIGTEMYGFDRIASNIVVGVGFIGAGVIFKGNDGVSGITTATTIWLSSAVGMGIGAGFILFSMISVGIIIIVLYGFKFIEHATEGVNSVKYYKIRRMFEENTSEFEKVFALHSLKSVPKRQHWIGEEGEITWEVIGSKKNHEQLVRSLIKDKKIISLEF